MSNKLNRHERLLCPYKPMKKQKVDTREREMGSLPGRGTGIYQGMDWTGLGYTTEPH